MSVSALSFRTYGLLIDGFSPIVYVGRTTKPLKERLNCHFRNAKAGDQRPVLSWIRANDYKVNVTQIAVVSEIDHSDIDLLWKIESALIVHQAKQLLFSAHRVLLNCEYNPFRFRDGSLNVEAIEQYATAMSGARRGARIVKDAQSNEPKWYQRSAVQMSEATL